MPLTLEDRLAITELIALHGHLVDKGELDRAAEVFTPDVEYDLTDFDQGTGEELADGQVRVRSKGLGIRTDGSCGSVTYVDTVVRVGAGWRIARRRLEARRVPLNGLTPGTEAP